MLVLFDTYYFLFPSSLSVLNFNRVLWWISNSTLAKINHPTQRFIYQSCSKQNVCTYAAKNRNSKLVHFLCRKKPTFIPTINVGKVYLTLSKYIQSFMYLSKTKDKHLINYNIVVSLSIKRKWWYFFRRWTFKWASLLKGGWRWVISSFRGIAGGGQGGTWRVGLGHEWCTGAAGPFGTTGAKYGP